MCQCFDGASTGRGDFGALKALWQVAAREALSRLQGDRIGRSYAHWAIVYIGLSEKYKSTP
jgi:hypothetical protein